jgi:potassium-transporting ATPase KdpC subunit
METQPRKENGKMKKKKKNGYGSHVRPIIGLALVSCLVAGLFFPIFVTAIGQVLFPYQANGSLAKLDGRTVGSVLIAQGFNQPIFFQPRNGSASGVDPDITVEDAMSQVPAINNATGIPAPALVQLVDRNIDLAGRFVEDQYVNVLELNIQLIQDYPTVYSQYR